VQLSEPDLSGFAFTKQFRRTHAQYPYVCFSPRFRLIDDQSPSETPDLLLQSLFHRFCGQLIPSLQPALLGLSAQMDWLAKKQLPVNLLFWVDQQTASHLGVNSWRHPGSSAANHWLLWGSRYDIENTNKINSVRLQKKRGQKMGDKGKKDREKSRKQKTRKKDDKAKKAKAKQEKHQKDPSLRS
jgi:hypothetical protein